MPEQVVIDFTDDQWERVIYALRLHAIDPTPDAVAQWLRDCMKRVVQSAETNAAYDEMKRNQAIAKAADSW